MTKNPGKIESVISAGSDLGGAAIGGALGFLAGGPGGAAVAGALGVVVARVGKDVAARLLSNREEVRVGAAAAISIDEIRRRLSRGDKVRSDGFFDNSSDERSKAEEVFEGTLLASKNSHEERKVRHISKLFSNVAFDETCESSEANYSLHIAESLTYSQFVLMQLFSLASNPFQLRENPYGAGELLHYATISLLQSTKELADLQLLRMQKNGAPNGTIIMGVNGICPADLKLTVSGERLRNLLSLSEIEQCDLLDAASWLG